MDNKNNNEKMPSLEIDLSPELAGGVYSNLAMIVHGPNDVFLDFMLLTPRTPNPRVQSRIIMTPENAKNLMLALQDNIRKYEATFGTIEQKMPKNMNGQGGQGGDIPNPFEA